MNFNPQYEVIGPYNYDRIIHNIENMYENSPILYFIF